MSMDDAGFGRFLDEATIQYVRVYPHPIERVWRAVTEPREIRAWFMPARIELRANGAWSFGGEDDWDGVISALDPPRFVRFEHGPRMPGGSAGYFEYALEPIANGTRLTFTHHFPGAEGGLARESDGVAGGWHELFDSLGEWLDGVEIGSRLPHTELAGVVEAWAASMVRGGEFDKATARRYLLDLRREEAASRLNRRYRELSPSALAIGRVS